MSNSGAYLLAFSDSLYMVYSSYGRVSWGLTAVSILVVVLTLSLLTLQTLVRKWGSWFRAFTSYGGTKFIWNKKYPTFEDMHALFDRGDALMAAVCVATTLQLAHEEVAKTLISHSTYKTDPLRRLVRTLTFIRISLRSNSVERLQVVSWLNKIHGNIKLFKVETNLFILATIAYGLARAQQALGSATEIEADAIVSTIMNMGKQLSPADVGLEMSTPNTLSAVTDFLSKRVDFSLLSLEDLNNAVDCFKGSLSKRRSLLAGPSSSKSSMVFHPLSSIKFFTLMHLIRDLSFGIFKPGTPINPRPGQVLSIIQKFQPLYYHFHYTLCPRFLTFDGLFEVLYYADPSLKAVMNEVYEEIFGDNFSATQQRQGVDKRISAPGLPQLQTLTAEEKSVQDVSAESPNPELISSVSLYSAVVEHFKCSYLRGQLLSRTVPQHLGVIMDGNRRFAKQNQLGGPVEGHRAGARKLLDFISWCFSSGIHNVTVWALSDDNLKRGTAEIDPLFAMMAEYIREMLMGDTPIAVVDMRYRVVGDRSYLPQKLTRVIDEAEKATRNNRDFNFQLALGYGGRAEATRAMKRAVEFKARERSVPIEEALSSLTPRDVSKHTYSAELGLPEMDAILRTSGENRLSGFALWETHGAEISFVESTWPAFTQSDFLRCVVDLSNRQKRFGA